MKKHLEGFRKWFEALGDTARLMVTRDSFVETMEVSAMLNRQRSRDAEWERVSAMAGLTPDGSIAPPPPGLRISREPPQWWKAYPPIVSVAPPAGKLDLRPGTIAYARVYLDKDEQAMCEVEGRPFDGHASSLC